MMTYVWISTVSTCVLAFLTVCPIAAFLFNKNILYSTVSFCLLVCCVFLMHEFIRFQSETTKQKQNSYLNALHMDFLILNNLKIVYIFILWSPTSKQILKSLRQYPYFYFDCANVSWHVTSWLIFFHIRFWSLILSIV